MAIKVLALASGVTGLGDHRILESAFLNASGTLSNRAGLLPSSGAGNLTTVSAMVARVAPLKLVIQNSIAASLGPYVLVSDNNVDITFDAGEVSVDRVDRIIARAYDNANDGSGLTEGSIYYLKGQASGTATAMPNNSLLLYEVTVPAGTTAGGGGINFATAVDRRVYTVTAGGVIPVANYTELTAVVAPMDGQLAYRKDIDAVVYYDGSTWRPQGVVSVAAAANLSSSNLNPIDGSMAVTRDQGTVYVYDGSNWLVLGSVGNSQDNHARGEIARGNRTSAITFTSEVGYLRLDNVLVKAGRVYELKAARLRATTSPAGGSDAFKFHLRLNSSGTATTSSTIQGRSESHHAETVELTTFYRPGADQTISVLLTVLRTSGASGTVTLNSDEGGIDLVIKDLGISQSDTGVDI